MNRLREREREGRTGEIHVRDIVVGLVLKFDGVFLLLSVRSQDVVAMRREEKGNDKRLLIRRRCKKRGKGPSCVSFGPVGSDPFLSSSLLFASR